MARRARPIHEQPDPQAMFADVGQATLFAQPQTVARLKAGALSHEPESDVGSKRPMQEPRPSEVERPDARLPAQQLFLPCRRRPLAAKGGPSGSVGAALDAPHRPAALSP